MSFQREQHEWTSFAAPGGGRFSQGLLDGCLHSIVYHDAPAWQRPGVWVHLHSRLIPGPAFLELTTKNTRSPPPSVGYEDASHFNPVNTSGCLWSRASATSSDCAASPPRKLACWSGGSAHKQCVTCGMQSRAALTMASCLARIALTLRWWDDPRMHAPHRHRNRCCQTGDRSLSLKSAFRLIAWSGTLAGLSNAELP